MPFWANGLVLTVVWLTVVLGAAALLTRLPGMSRVQVPTSIVAGFIGLMLGPSVLGLVPFDREALEALVYHGLAIVFIAVSLQEPKSGARTDEARSYAFTVATMNILQAIVGLAFVLVWTALAFKLHPGFGLMLPLGFQQGPGQALSLGTAWESVGMIDGGAIGLIFAAAGFVHCVLLGVPLVMIGRARGWLDPESWSEPASGEETDGSKSGSGGLEPLTAQLAAVGACYAFTYLFLSVVTPRVSPQDAAMLWGFHFILGSVFALLGRFAIGRLPVPSPLDRDLQGRIAAVAVDFTTAGAIAAVQVDVLQQWAVPVLLLTTLGGVFTLLSCLWISARAFPAAPFEHALVLFGSSTGTVPTGLALLRTVDPELRSPAPRTTVLGSSMALILAAPLLIVVIKMPITGWPESYPSAVYTTLGVLLAYQFALLVAWRWMAPLQLGDRPLALWPRRVGEDPPP